MATHSPLAPTRVMLLCPEDVHPEFTHKPYTQFYSMLWWLPRWRINRSESSGLIAFGCLVQHEIVKSGGDGKEIQQGRVEEVNRDIK